MGRVSKWFLVFVIVIALGFCGLRYSSVDNNEFTKDQLDIETLEADTPEQKAIKEKLLALQEEKGRPLKEEEALSALPEKLAK